VDAARNSIRRRLANGSRSRQVSSRDTNARSRLAALGRLIDLLDARRNQLFLPLSSLLLWATQLAHAIESWRTISGPAVPRWLATVGEFEALCALASYAWENPDDPFPQVVAAGDGPRFDGEGLGHPLIPGDVCVRNDVRLAADGSGDGPRALVISGSNMSGKSTLLRTVGVNTVLALAGAPVRARRLMLTPLSVGATLRVHDSLQAGTSRFYAEITRLRKIVDLTAGTPPPLFLLDEMLNGTNSRDRRIGAEAVLKGLIGRGGVGLVTTHDLALSEIAEALAPRAANVHFEDHLEDGQMTFDYICRPGVMTKSNALELMRAVGLDT
jgi:DNA mismatch repair ATPase MutS